ncbi:hypothetical protein SUDANB1_03805 [Streptomyces sp. enrichment culture]
MLRPAGSDGRCRRAADGFLASFPRRVGRRGDKRHWITLQGGESLDRGLVDELVTDSCLLVVAKLPKARPPVDPAAFARGGQSPR